MDQRNKNMSKEYWDFVEKITKEAATNLSFNGAKSIDIYRAYIMQSEPDIQEDQNE